MKQGPHRAQTSVVLLPDVQHYRRFPATRFGPFAIALGAVWSIRVFLRVSDNAANGQEIEIVAQGSK
jgi:hypothetical protein